MCENVLIPIKCTSDDCFFLDSLLLAELNVSQVHCKRVCECIYLHLKVCAYTCVSGCLRARS